MESAMKYDEDDALTNYVLQNFGEWMTPLESQTMKAVHAEEKARRSGSEQVASVIRRRWGELEDDQVARALEHGAESFRRGVRERLLREKAEDIIINRCPSCDRIVRTPRARQCLWCGYDWH
jgi:hypothetical protein